MMESWCFDSPDKGYISNETCDSITRTKNALMGWEFKDPISCDSSMLIPSQQTVGYPEVGFTEMLRTQLPHDSVRNAFNSNVSVGGIISPSVFTSNAISEDDESSSKPSNSVMNSKIPESSLIDLKLGGFGNKPNSNSSRAAPVSSSSESPTPAKRVRVTNLSSQPAYCQVYGCNKDLSPLKDYYKRHRVCEAHSKTSKVIVNGIEQRFCQQCSRFHLVAEFDNGKRSCRKRLAGHNERRRKPQVGSNSSRAGISRDSYAGSEGSWLPGSTLSSSSTSFVWQEMNGFSRIEKHRRNEWGTHAKVEDETNCGRTSKNTCVNGQLDQKSALPSFIPAKGYPSLMNNGNNTRLGNYFSKDIDQNPQGIFSNSLFQSNSLMNEDWTCFYSASTIPALAEASDSGCALSLLSSQSPLSSSPCYSMSEISEKASGVENRCSSYGDTVRSAVGSGVLQGCEFMNIKDQLSLEDEGTIDLLQLSSQLHPVRSQSQSRHVRRETKGLCCLRMT